MSGAKRTYEIFRKFLLRTRTRCNYPKQISVLYTCIESLSLHVAFWLTRYLLQLSLCPPLLNSCYRSESNPHPDHTPELWSIHADFKPHPHPHPHPHSHILTLTLSHPHSPSYFHTLTLIEPIIHRAEAMLKEMQEQCLARSSKLLLTPAYSLSQLHDLSTLVLTRTLILSLTRSLP